MNLKTVIGIVIGYIIYMLICPLPSKKCIFEYNQIQCGSFTLHFHHWFTSILILLLFDMNNIHLNDFLRGLLISGILHGIIEYNDWYVFLKPSISI